MTRRNEWYETGNHKRKLQVLVENDEPLQNEKEASGKGAGEAGDT